MACAVVSDGEGRRQAKDLRRGGAGARRRHGRRPLDRRFAQARVLSLWIDGQRGFAIYEGDRNQVSATPMARESDQWKVSALAAPL